MGEIFIKAAEKNMNGYKNCLCIFAQAIFITG